MRHGFYIPEPFAGVGLAPSFAPLSKEALYKEAPPPNFFAEVPHVELQEAAAIVLPNNFKTLDAASGEYIKRYADLAEKEGIPFYLFSLGDFTDKIVFDPRAYVFRLSVYKSKKGPRDIVIPTLTEDLGRGGITLREKQAVPVVAFCGMAGFATFRRWVAYGLKNLRADLQGAPERKLGVYWRRAAMKALAKSPLVQTSFIVRKTFSGDARTVELSPLKAREEFIQNIETADFVLAPKGDGNYSNRFLEALSMGRIPVLIDTDSALPSEEVVEYAKIVVRVPMHDVEKAAEYIRKFYDALSPQEWKERQQLARSVFEQHLRQDAFFRFFFGKHGELV